MMNKYKPLLAFLIIATISLLLDGNALADGIAQPWQIGFQGAASPVAERLHAFSHMLNFITFAIFFFVFFLIVFVVTRFNAKANPEPRIFAHNTPLEVIWTVLPVLILVVIAIPSMKLLYYSDRTANPEMTLKVTGNQWFWSYEYPDNNGISFSSYMIPDKEIDSSKNQVRLLSVDNPIVLPIDTNIQILVTASDVLHSFTVPALGFKTDAVPGRINETWVRITKPGIYYGQCSELCGKDHAYMPVEVHAVTKEEFQQWVGQASQQSGLSVPSSPVQLAHRETE
jgi:cytochrome c oxidase subunit II